MTQDMTRKMTINVAKAQRGNVLFPAWKCFVSSVGINNSPKAHFLRSLLLLLTLLAFGSSMSWGQDYSGTYYIASAGKSSGNGNKYTYSPSNPSNNFYLCPTEGWCYYQDPDNFWPSDTEDDNKTMPFLTTFKCRTADYHSGNASDAVWIIKKAPNSDYYYIIQKSTGRYLVSNGQIETTNNPDRIRVHLQSFGSEEQLAAQGNKVLFEIVISSLSTTTSTYIEISPKGITDGTSTAHGDHDKHKWLTVNNGNYTNLVGNSGKTGGPTGYENTCGIVCLYSKGDNNAPFCLEDVIARPTISYDSNNKVVITAAQTGATIRYTLDGTTPSADHGTEYDTPLEPALGTTIKAVAIIGGEVSNIATFTYIKLADSYVIQSKDCEFYNLIPNLKVGETDYPKNLTTLNVPCNTMVWDFENAADNDGQYYYIHNSQQGGYLYYTATDNSNKYVYFNADKDADDNGYKFSISAHASGGFNIIPKGQTLPINKTSITASGNNKLIAVKLTGSLADATSRWALITYSAETKRTCLPQWKGDAPFTESDGGHTYYYRINSVSQPTKPLILDNGGDIKSTTVPTSGYDNRKSVWVIKKVGSDTDGLLDYYTFQNAYTGELLYINKMEKEVEDDFSPGMLQMGQPDGADATWSHFVIVQTINNGYNIIPRVLVDNTKATGTGTTTHEGFNCINRANGSIYTGTWYDNDGASRWTFEQKTDVKCMNPVYAEDTDGNFTISCVTNAAVIHYTTNGEEPTASSSVYETPIGSASEKICIKAIAIVGDGADDYSKSEIVTLMNKPDITLKEGTAVVDDNTYVYDGTAKEPAVTVSIGDVVAPTAPTNTYTIAYANNTNAGTETSIPTVTITDVDDDLWIINPNTASKTFVINPRDLTLTWTNTELEYTGTEQKPILTVGNIVEGETLTVTVSIVEDGGGINVGSYTATATSVSNTNYVLPTDPITTSYTINPKGLGDGLSPSSGISVTLNDGGPVTFTVMHGAVQLTEETDYTVEEDSENHVWTITGKGNYTGSIKVMRATLNFDNTGEDGAVAETKVKVSPYVAPADMTIDGVEAYMVTHVNMTRYVVTIKKILTKNADPTLKKNYAPKDIPVLLLKDLAEATTSTSLTATPINVAEDEAADVSDNLLKITPAEGKAFTFGEVYMYHKAKFVMTTGGQMSGGTFYLERMPGSGASSAPLYIAFDEVYDETTDVEDVRCKMDDGRADKWYAIDGRRLSGKPTKKGLYIKNGEKVVIK